MPERLAGPAPLVEREGEISPGEARIPQHRDFPL